MKSITKSSIVLLCVLLCAGGVVFSQKEKTQDKQPKNKVAPVNNRERNRAAWILT